MSIALNATAAARAVATQVLDTEDLRDVLQLLGAAGDADPGHRVISEPGKDEGAPR
jgi:hypothetical protein